MQSSPLFVRPKYLFEMNWSKEQFCELLSAYDSLGYESEQSREAVIRLLTRVQGLEN